MPTSEIPAMPEDVRVAAYQAEPKHDLNAALDYVWRAAYDVGHADGYGAAIDASIDAEVAGG